MRGFIVGLFLVGFALIGFVVASFVATPPADKLTVSCANAVPGMTYVAKPYGSPAFTFTCVAPKASVAQ